MASSHALHLADGLGAELALSGLAQSRKLAFFCDPFGNLIELAEVLA